MATREMAWGNCKRDGMGQLVERWHGVTGGEMAWGDWRRDGMG